RRVPVSVPGEDQHSAHAHRVTRDAASSVGRRQSAVGSRQEAYAAVGATGVLGVEGSAEAAVVVSVVAAAGTLVSATEGKGRLAVESAGTGCGLDGGPRLPGSGGTVVPGAVESRRTGSVSCRVKPYPQLRLHPAAYAAGSLNG